jgi:hypothetical protein
LRAIRILGSQLSRLSKTSQKPGSLLKNSPSTALGAILFSFACSIGRKITANLGTDSR